MTDLPNRSADKRDQGPSKRRRNPLAVIVAVVVIVSVIAAGLIRSRLSRAKGRLVAFSVSPEGIMGTQTQLIAVAPRNETRIAQASLDKAVKRIRDIEAMMSMHIDSTPLSRFNSAKAGEHKLPADIIKLLIISRKIYHQSGGAFDVTCLPIVKLWKRSARLGKLPTKRQITQARTSSNWDQITINPLDNTATKQIDTVAIDLGGIAKGFAVDQAVKVLKSAGISGGMVDIGGDLRCFGTSPDGPGWKIKIQNPFDSSSTCATLILTDAAVATSGDYNRFSIIAGKRFSHIVDPRTSKALLAGRVCSATVVSLPTGQGPACGTLADGWATAISVLGAVKGINLVNKIDGLEAMIITGNADNYHIYLSTGFLKLLKPPMKITLK